MKIAPSISFYIKTNNKFYNALFIKTLKFIFLQNRLINFKINNIQNPQKLKKISLLKSPHIYKTAWSQIELKKISSTLLINNFTKNEFKKIKNIIYFLKKNLQPNLKLKIKYTKYKIV